MFGQGELTAAFRENLAFLNVSQRAERSPAAVSEPSESGAAWASVCFSAPESRLELPSVSRLALQPALPLQSEAPLHWA